MRNRNARAVVPTFGGVRPVSPAFFFDFHDQSRAGGAPTTLQDQSHRYWAGKTQRPSLTLNGAVSTAWDTEAGYFDFNGATPHYFDEGVDILSGGYADVLSPEKWGILLLWWRVKYDSIITTNKTLFSFGALTGATNRYGFGFEFSQALGRHRWYVTDGNGTGEFRNEDAVPPVSYDTSTYFNLALALDRANRLHTWYQNGVAGAAQAWGPSQITDNLDNNPEAGRRFVLAGAMVNDGSSVNAPFDGRLQRIGGINLPADTAVDIARVVRKLHARKCIPGAEFHGI